MASQEVTLKIHMGAMVKNMQFQSIMHIEEVRYACKKEMQSKDPSKTYADHKIYWIEKKTWPEPHHALQYYDIHSGTEFEFRKCHRPLKVRLPDNSNKTMVIDESLPIKGIIAVICENLELTCPQEFGLQLDPTSTPNPNRPDAAQHKSKYFNPYLIPNCSDTDEFMVNFQSGAKKEFRATDKRMRLPINQPWLLPAKFLSELDVPPEAQLVFKFRFFHNMNPNAREKLRNSLLFHQAVTMYLGGYVFVNEEEIVDMAAILAQMQWGDISLDGSALNGPKVTPDFLEKHQEAIVPRKCLSKKVAKKIISAHHGLNGSSVEMLQMCFVRAWASTESFGIENLSGYDKIKPKIKCLLGISSRHFFFVSQGMKKPMIEDLSKMKKMLRDHNNVMTLSFTGCDISLKCDQPVDLVADTIMGTIELITEQQNRPVEDETEVFMKNIEENMQMPDNAKATMRRFAKKQRAPESDAQFQNIFEAEHDLDQVMAGLENL